MKSQFMHVELYSREEPAKKTINKSKNINHKWKLKKSRLPVQCTSYLPLAKVALPLGIRFQPTFSGS